ncbi:MAG: DUF922 domain-containing protein [Xanthomonadales bacterium]|nr:DUF922 domain-containing protein [Xanthomonadales bacterium]MCB1565371.1 DUF922 domain-containing protein [Xanthomonadales bacterium]
MSAEVRLLRCLFAATGLLLVWIPLPAWTADADATVELVVHETERHYDVFASDIEQLLAELRVPGGEPGSGIHAHGLTTTELQMSRETGQRGSQCRLERAKLELSVTVTTPRWDPARPVPESLASEWPRIRRLIEEHEDAHRQNALAAARWLNGRIDELGSWQPCSLLSAKLSRYIAASQTRRGLQDALLDSRAAARSELTRTIRRVRFQRQRPDWMN